MKPLVTVTLILALGPPAWVFGQEDSRELNSGIVGVPLKPLPGTFVDDTTALLLGSWVKARSKDGYVGRGYRVSDDPKASIEYVIQAPFEGTFELRQIYAADPNWAHSVSVGVDYRGVVTKRMVSQRKRPTEGYYKAIGKYELSRNESLRIKIERPRGGSMYADAFQLIPLKSKAPRDSERQETP